MSSATCSPAGQVRPRRRAPGSHPMSFRDVLSATGRDVPLRRASAMGSSAGRDASCRRDARAVRRRARPRLAGVPHLRRLPRAVAEHHRTGEVSDAFLRDLAAWLHRDVDPEAGEDSVPKLLAEIERRSTRHSTGTALDGPRYANRQTLDRRLARLVHAFAALWCHQVDDDGNRVAGARSKLYLTDPSLRGSARGSEVGCPSGFHSPHRDDSRDDARAGGRQTGVGPVDGG